MDIQKTFTCMVTFLISSCGPQASLALPSFSQCRSLVDMADEGIYSGAVVFSYDAINNNPQLCEVTVRARENQRLMFYFKKLQLGREYYGRVYYKLELRQLIDRRKVLVKGMPDSMNLDTEINEYVYLTDGRELVTSLFSKKSRHHNFANVTLIFTSFHNGTCQEEDYRCGNDRCISKSLKCNNYNPCGDDSDCPSRLRILTNDSERSLVIMAAIFGGGIFIIMAAVCLRQDSSYLQQDNWSANDRRVSDGSVFEMNRTRYTSDRDSLYAGVSDITNKREDRDNKQHDSRLLQISRQGNGDSSVDTSEDFLQFSTDTSVAVDAASLTHSHHDVEPMAVNNGGFSPGLASQQSLHVSSFPCDMHMQTQSPPTFLRDYVSAGVHIYNQEPVTNAATVLESPANHVAVSSPQTQPFRLPEGCSHDPGGLEQKQKQKKKPPPPPRFKPKRPVDGLPLLPSYESVMSHSDDYRLSPNMGHVIEPESQEPMVTELSRHGRVI